MAGYETAICRILKNPVYAGRTEYNPGGREIITVPAIVSEPTFQRVQEQLRRNTDDAGRQTLLRLLVERFDGATARTRVKQVRCSAVESLAAEPRPSRSGEFSFRSCTESSIHCVSQGGGTT